VIGDFFTTEEPFNAGKFIQECPRDRHTKLRRLPIAPPLPEHVGSRSLWS